MNLFKRTKPAVSIEAVSIEENTEIFLDDFKKLVQNGNSTTLNDFIKFFVNSIQGELITKCYYNDRNYPKYDRYILYSLYAYYFMYMEKRKID